MGERSYLDTISIRRRLHRDRISPSSVARHVRAVLLVGITVTFADECRVRVWLSAEHLHHGGTHLPVSLLAPVHLISQSTKLTVSVAVHHLLFKPEELQALLETHSLKIRLLGIWWRPAASSRLVWNHHLWVVYIREPERRGSRSCGCVAEA